MQRRKFLSVLAVSGFGLSGCIKSIDRQRQEYGLHPLNQKEREVMGRFSHVGGVRIRIDAFGQKREVNFFDERMRLFYSRAGLSPKAISKFNRGSVLGPQIPISLRVRWRDEGLFRPCEPKCAIDDFESRHPAAYYGGNILGDFTSNVADRIPQDLLDEYSYYKKFGMGLHLKLRIHDQGLLVGWHIGHIFDRVHVGGDFEESHPKRIVVGPGNWTARQFNEGWYIHPVTKERITTSF